MTIDRSFSQQVVFFFISLYLPIYILYIFFIFLTKQQTFFCVYKFDLDENRTPLQKYTLILSVYRFKDLKASEGQYKDTFFHFCVAVISYETCSSHLL